MLSLRNRWGLLAARLPAGGPSHGPQLFRKGTTGKCRNHFICPVRLGRCNSLLRGGDSHGRAQAYATVLLYHGFQDAERRHTETCARRGTPCKLGPNARRALTPVPSEDCPKRNDRPTGVNFASETDGLRSPLLTHSL
jgi:hypothetical protein